MPSSIIGAIVASAVTGTASVFGFATSVFAATIARAAIGSTVPGKVAGARDGEDRPDRAP